MEKNILRKYIYTLLSVVAAVYTLWYMHFSVPYENNGALSKIGLEHKGAFVIWGILTTCALFTNTVYSYKKYTNKKFYIPMLALSAVGMVLTLCFDFKYDTFPDYYLHCAGSLTFSVSTGITVFILFFLNRKRGKVFLFFTVATATILLCDLICLIIFKENALIETIPVFAAYLMFEAVKVERIIRNRQK